MVLGYDNKSINHQMLLDLPFLEGIGAITHDQSKVHHEDVTLINTPTWATLSSGLGVLELDGAAEYAELANADSLDLDFLATDYSLGGWINWSHAAHDDQHIIGRYEIDVSGWELYLYDDPNYYLTLRHHHAGGATLRTACYSSGWVQDTWHFFGISRSGTSQAHYRNGVPLTVSCSAGGLINPETCAQDLTIGVRFTKGSEYFKNQMQGLRVWDRSLSASEWLYLFETEKHWFGL